jgi:Tfp pilus assembly protein PilN
LAELRLEDAEPRPLPELSYAAAVVSAISRRALAVNLLPADQRVSHSRWWMIPTLALLALIGMLSVVLWKQPEYQDRQLLKRLEDEIARVEPDARRAQQLEQQIAAAKARAAQLDEFRTRTPQDLETLLELTRVLPPPAWINTLDLTRTLVNLGGESPQADNLLSQLDNSPRFKESYYTAPLARGQAAELFRIRSTREILTEAPPTAPPAQSAPPAKPAPGAAQ